MDKKGKIITTAKRVFNQKSYDAVTLQEIAESMGMSRGNLVYHFKDKDQILQAIMDEMWAKILQDRTKSRSFPSFENLHHEVQMYQRYQVEYAFIFLNSQLFSHPIVQEKFKIMTEQTISANKATLLYSIQMGNMHPEPIPGVYSNIAFITWMLTFFWLAQQMIRGEKTSEDAEKMIWSLLLPYFTKKGKERFIKFYGDAYLETIGEPIHTSSFNHHSF